MLMFLISMHRQAGTAARDYLAFRIALAEELVGSFRGRRHIGRPRSLDNLRATAGRISWTLAGGCGGEVGLCAVFKGTGKARSQFRQESKVTCCMCNVWHAGDGRTDWGGGGGGGGGGYYHVLLSLSHSGMHTCR